MSENSITELRTTGNDRLMFSSNSSPSGDTLVNIFLSGGMDALYTIPPHADRELALLRGNTAIATTEANGEIIDLDGFYGLHPTLAPLAQAFHDQKMAIVYACGLPCTELSHFEAAKILDRGVGKNYQESTTGWIARYLNLQHNGNVSPLRAVAVSNTLPESFLGASHSIAFRSIESFGLKLPSAWRSAFPRLLDQMYGASNDLLGNIGKDVVTLLKDLEELQGHAYRPAQAVVYPESAFGAAIAQVAQLIKADVGLEVASLSMTGWDTHEDQVGRMQRPMQKLAQGVAALMQDLGQRMERVTIMVTTEFGRRVQPNIVNGTDHGRASAAFILGGNIAGGKVYGKWPGLAADQLDDGNLAVTTDIRDVIAEVVTKRLGIQQIDAVFPGYTPNPLNFAHAMNVPSNLSIR